MSIKTRRQIYYHSDEGFDYEKFYESIYSFIVPIIDAEYVLITTVFIYEEDGTPYAKYHIPEKFRKIPDFEDEAKFLEEHKIYFDKEKGKENIKLSVFQIYNEFEKLNLSDRNSPIRPTDIENYFSDVGTELLDPSEFNFDGKEHTIDNFLNAEKIYLKAGFDKIGEVREIESLEILTYFPIPIISQGCLVGVIYLMVPPSSIRGVENIAQHKEATLFQYIRLLLLQATREYENVRLESRFTYFNLKPQDPLEDYLTVFWDLTTTLDDRKRKRIIYKPLYGNQEIVEKRVITENEFLSDLGYDDYYEHVAPVIIKESLQLLQNRFDKIKTAITAIIVDSFAHNIGAHSLVALKWWFENRYKIAAKSFKTTEVLSSTFDPQKLKNEVLELIKKTEKFHAFIDDFDHSVKPKKILLLNIVRFMDEETKEQLLKYSGETEMARFPVPVAQSIYQFFQYLRDKSAFWSGATRDTVFSGEIKSWKNLIRDFIGNSLFLGTIAHSEGINKLELYIEILGKYEDEKANKILISGEYAKINLEVIEKEKKEALGFSNPKLTRDEDGYSDYAFIRKGRDFDRVQIELEKLDDVFLPNAIIGQHALYTILENTLRNIKHYKKQIKEIQEKGIKLYISIQSVPLWKRKESANSLYEHTKENCLFKVGTWLHHPQELLRPDKAKVNEEGDEHFHHEGAVIESHTQQLRRRVVNKTGNPILGGSSQDKVCAAMLMNNSFMSIDEVDIDKVKRHYFPYVYTASEFFVEPHERTPSYCPLEDYLHKIYNFDIAGETSEERREKYKEYVKKYIRGIRDRKNALNPDPNYAKGTIKKYFHIWKGRRCQIMTEDFDPKSDNISRFKIVAVDKYMKTEIVEGKTVKRKLVFRNDDPSADKKNTAEYELRNRGIVRLVEADHQWKALQMTSEWKALTEDQKRQSIFQLAMQKWLGEWLGEDKERIDYLICMPAGYKFLPSIVISLIKREGNWAVEWTPDDRIERDDELDAIIEADESIRNLPRLQVNHGAEYQDESCCRIRSHCAFLNEVFPKNTSLGELSNTDFDQKLDGPMRLLETGLTHITFFDDRVHERLPLYEMDSEKEKRYGIFKHQLNINVFPEKHELFNDENRNKTLKSILRKKSHFIVMHLSFLESIKNVKAGVSYKEDEVAEFFNNEFAAFYENTFLSHIPPNIILVIISGRGRGDWFAATSDPQITFRPVEAILDAIEDGLSLNDDFQVKFNLCNVLFGS